MADGRVVYEIVGDNSPFSRDVNKTQDIAKSVASGIGKAFTAASAAAVAGITALAGSAMSQFAEYEQLVGGVETLFKDSADIVMNYAENAYKTAGLSANEYMATVTSFSASLLQSLGGDTVKAAEYADRAITDMSDNANKMGTDMVLIQNAYQGFAKQNFTMLDNLKLGYGGTQEEMKRLLEDATALSGITYDMSSYADIVEAIHVIQEEMGIAGTTALEASSTIQGSIASMGSAWKNLVAGLANDEADLGQLAQNLIDSIVTVGDNVIPRLQILLPRITEGLTTLVNNLIPQIAPIMSAVLPEVIRSALEIVTGLTEILPEIIVVIEDMIPEIIDVIANDVFPAIFETLLNSAPLLLDTAFTLFYALVEALISSIPLIVQAVPELVLSLIDAILSNIPLMVEAGVELLVALIANLPLITVRIVAAIPQIINGMLNAIKNSIPIFREMGSNLIKGLWNGINDVAGWLWNKVSGYFNKLTDKIKDFFGIASPSKLFENEIGKNLALGVAVGVEKNVDKPIDATQKMAEDIFSAVPWLINRSFSSNAYSSFAGGGGESSLSFSIAKLADQIIVREDADIEKISRALMNKVRQNARGKGVS